MNRLHLSVVVCLFLVVVPASQASETTLVEAKNIWESETSLSMTDLVRFKDAWYCVFYDRPKNSANKMLRVITSADGVKWESAADVTCRYASRGDADPRLTVTPRNELMIVAMGSIVGHTTQAYSWTSKDGRRWETPRRFCEEYYRVKCLRWHKGELYSFSRGCICGNASTLHIDGGGRGVVYKETPSYWPGPGSGSLVFTDDVAYCFMARNPTYRIDLDTREYYVHKAPGGVVSSSKPPFNNFGDWKGLGVRIANPNAMRLADGRIIVSVGLFDKKKERTSLCWFDRKTVKLQETLELPVGRSAIVGLASHDGHVWISYHKPHEEKSHVYLAKVKLASGLAD